jgi:hypothetical protein
VRSDTGDSVEITNHVRNAFVDFSPHKNWNRFVDYVSHKFLTKQPLVVAIDHAIAARVSPIPPEICSAVFETSFFVELMPDSSADKEDNGGKYPESDAAHGFFSRSVGATAADS